MVTPYQGQFWVTTETKEEIAYGLYRKKTLPNGKIYYRARIRIHGMPAQSATFSTRTHAKEWARKKESEMRASRYFPRDEGKNRTFATFVDYYITHLTHK